MRSTYLILANKYKFTKWTEQASVKFGGPQISTITILPILVPLPGTSVASTMFRTECVLNAVHVCQILMQSVQIVERCPINSKFSPESNFNAFYRPVSFRIIWTVVKL